MSTMYTFSIEHERRMTASISDRMRSGQSCDDFSIYSRYECCRVRFISVFYLLKILCVSNFVYLFGYRMKDGYYFSRQRCSIEYFIAISDYSKVELFSKSYLGDISGIFFFVFRSTSKIRNWCVSMLYYYYWRFRIVVKQIEVRVSGNFGFVFILF